MKRPLVVFTLLFCLGIFLAGALRINLWFILAAGAAALLSGWRFRSDNRVFACCVFFLALLLGALSLKNFYIRQGRRIDSLVRYRDRSVYAVSGFVDGQPALKNGCTSFVFCAQEIQSGNYKWPCQGRILVRMDFPQDLAYGRRLTLLGSLKRPFRLPGGRRGYRDYLTGQGIYLLMHIHNSLQVIRWHGYAGSKLILFSMRLRMMLERLLGRYLADIPAGIISAMVLGQRDYIPWLVNESMVKTGTVHILVVSGFNVGIVAFIFGLLFKIARLRRKARIILTAACLIVYCLVTGASNPVVRATVMGVVFLSAYLVQREADIYNSLACAVLFILIVNPLQIFDIGFQLSFSSVMAIVCLYPRLKAFLRPDRCRFAPLRFICEGCLVSFCAWAGTAGIIAYNFRIISPVTVLANIFVVPVATLITLCGFSLILCSCACPALGWVFAAPASALVTVLLNINYAMSRIPFACFYL
jgi:competence protein ComEC